MKTIKQCSTCKFFFEEAWCRRFPPVLVGEKWDIPRVQSKSVCGEWTKPDSDDDDEDLK